MSPAPKKVRSIPSELERQRRIRFTTQGQSYLDAPSLLRFATDGGKIYVMIRGDSKRYRLVRNQYLVRLESCTIMGRVTGPEFLGQAYILPESEWPWARHLLSRKYWLLKIPFLWSKQNEFLEITLS